MVPSIAPQAMGAPDTNPLEDAVEDVEQKEAAAAMEEEGGEEEEDNGLEHGVGLGGGGDDDLGHLNDLNDLKPHPRPVTSYWGGGSGDLADGDGSGGSSGIPGSDIEVRVEPCVPVCNQWVPWAQLSM